MNWKALCYALAVGGLALPCLRAQESENRWPSIIGSRESEDEPVDSDEIDAEAADESSARGRWGGGWAQWSWRPRAWEWKQPAFMQRMSENSARSWRNTRRGVGNWMSQTGTQIRESTYDTWDAITRATTPRRAAQKQDVRPVPPSNGRVHEFLSRPRVKF